MQNNIPTVHNSEIHCYIVKSNNLSTIFGVLFKKIQNLRLSCCHDNTDVNASLRSVTDDRLYQMNHCVSIRMIFVSAIFARLSRQMTRATLTAKMALTAKMRDCSRFMA